MATWYNNLAGLLQATNRLAEVEPLYRRAIAIGEASYGPDHPTVAIRLNNLAGLLRATNRLAEAEPLYRRALTIRESSFGPDHPDTIRAYNNNAYRMRKSGDVAGAEPLDRRVLELSMKNGGEDAPLTIHRRNNLVLTLTMKGSLAEAKSILNDNARAERTRCSNTTPRILLLTYLVDILENLDGEQYIGQLKALLSAKPLRRDVGIAWPWDIGYVLDYLRDRLTERELEFLQELVSVINEEKPVTELERFEEWRNVEAVGLTDDRAE